MQIQFIDYNSYEDFIRFLNELGINDYRTIKLEDDVICVHVKRLTITLLEMKVKHSTLVTEMARDLLSQQEEIIEQQDELLKLPIFSMN